MRAPLSIGATVVQDCVFLLYSWKGALYGDARYLPDAEQREEVARMSGARRRSVLSVTIHLI